ncbi:MAG: thioesterase family protein [Rubrivivax sp.]|jgi:uncharacterized protein (TIGR00369 family)
MTSGAVPPRSIDEQKRLEQALIDLFEHKITFHQVLGLKVLSVRPGDVRTRIDMRPELVGHYGYGRLHGGVTAAILDPTGALAIMVAMSERHPNESAETFMQRFARMATIDLRTDYLRQGIGQYFVASAEVTRLGGRVSSTQMRLVNEEGTLIATGSAAYIVA